MITKLQANALRELNNVGGFMGYDDSIDDYGAYTAESDFDWVCVHYLTALSLVRRKFVIKIKSDCWKITDAGREALTEYEARKGCE